MHSMLSQAHLIHLEALKHAQMQEEAIAKE